LRPGEQALVIFPPRTRIGADEAIAISRRGASGGRSGARRLQPAAVFPVDEACAKQRVADHKAGAGEQAVNGVARFHSRRHSRAPRYGCPATPRRRDAARKWPRTTETERGLPPRGVPDRASGTRKATRERRGRQHRDQRRVERRSTNRIASGNAASARRREHQQGFVASHTGAIASSRLAVPAHAKREEDADGRDRKAVHHPYMAPAKAMMTATDGEIGCEDRSWPLSHHLRPHHCAGVMRRCG